jgi:predicted AAA+ superfamily ATPase
MGLIDLIKSGSIEVWEDVYDARLDDKAAPDLGDIVKGREEPIYSDPEEFFRRTYLTSSMRVLLEDVAETLAKGKSGRIFLLTSLFGGGKTHTQIALYHAFNSPDKLKALDEPLAFKIAEVGRPIIVVMDGSRADLVPHPKEPFKAEGFTIKTIWGMLAYRLGAYAKMKHLDSERAPAPDVTLLRDLLMEARGPLLILMDEIVHYVFNMNKSPELREYGERVKLFLDYLARAVEDTPRTALVVSVQAEYRVVEGQKQLFEEEVFKDYARMILTVLSRESTSIISPVSPEDVVEVLKRRLFKKIPEDKAAYAKDKLYRVYRESPELFGVESEWQFSPGEAGRLASAKDTYPFHPKYVEVLQEFVTRNRDLQKTRDAVRITRKVVRRLLKGREDADFIMPWHIDLRDADIRNRVLTDSYREFRDIASRDIVAEDGRLGSVAECSKPPLALKIATVVLLKTYTYETFKEPLKVFPDKKSVALMVYEPETFARNKWTPLDIETALDEMRGALPHFTEENGRYWFTPYYPVIEYVQKRAEELLKGPKTKLYEVLKENVRGLLLKRDKRGLMEKGEVFDERNVIIVGYGDYLWEEALVKDDPSIKLVVLIKPEVSEDEVRSLILMKGEGGRRTYRNTVVCLCPHLNADFERLHSFAAKILASEEVMESLAEYYTDKEVRGLMETKLKRFVDNIRNNLNLNLLSTLTRIAYPRRGAKEDEIGWVETTAFSSIISQVEAGLKDPSTGPKLRTDFSFNDLADLLRMNLNWDLIEGVERREFREIVNFFQTATVAPLTNRGAIERALLEGVERLDIGIKVDDKLYWKRPGVENGAELPPTSLKDSAEILSYRLAANILKERLLAESGEQIAGRELRVVWYEVKVADRRVKLQDLILEKGWEKALKVGLILKQEQMIPRGFLLKVEPSYVRIKSGETVVVKVSVKPVDVYPYKVRLSTYKGVLSIYEGECPFESSWSLGVFEEPGDHVFKLDAIGEDGTTTSFSLTVSVESLEEEVNVEKLDVTHVGAKLIRILPKDLTSYRQAVEVISKLNLDAEASVAAQFGREISFTGRGMDVKLAALFISKFREIIMTLPQLEKETTVSGVIELRQPLVLDSSKITAFVPLSDKAYFRLRVKRHE